MEDRVYEHRFKQTDDLMPVVELTSSPSSLSSVQHSKNTQQWCSNNNKTQTVPSEHNSWYRCGMWETCVAAVERSPISKSPHPTLGSWLSSSPAPAPDIAPLVALGAQESSGRGPLRVSMMWIVPVSCTSLPLALCLALAWLVFAVLSRQHTSPK